MLRGLLLTLAILTAPVNRAGLEALGMLTDLRVYRGTYYYLDSTREVGLEAKGKDQFGNQYRIKCRWSDGYPVAIVVIGPEEEI